MAGRTLGSSGRRDERWESEEWPWQEIIDAGFDRADVIDGAWPLDPKDCDLPVILDESGNLIDGYHRVLGMIEWAEEQGKSLDRVRASVVEIPDALGEQLFGRGITTSAALDLIARYGRR